MSVAFAIKDRCGFNLTACEETLLLDAYEHVEGSIQTHPPIKLFQDLFLGQGKAVGETAIIVINEAITTAQLPANLKFVPRPTDWDSYTRVRDEERVSFREAIRKKLTSAERTRLIRAARLEYDLLPDVPRRPASDYDRMFAEAVERIRNGQLHRPRPLYAEDAPQPLLEAPRSLTMAAPRPERVSLSTLSMLPAAARVAQAANELALHRGNERDLIEQVAELRRQMEEAQEKLGAMQEHSAALRAMLAQALEGLE